MADSPNALRGLIVDWGGVLTAPLDDAMTEWARVEGIDFGLFREVMTDWVGSAGAGPAISGGSGDQLDEAEVVAGIARLNTPVHALERGELATGEFERVLSEALRAKGADVPADGLLTRMLAGLADTRDDMVNLIRRARGAGLRTALLSNSWGEHYPEHAWVGAFDAVVISGRVGMRKPDADIYLHTAQLLDLPPGACVFVDDAQRNIVGAVAVGMVGVLHESYEKTLTELEILFDRPLG
ncbi:HAD family hydrolase [Spongisporangium articulatum]|uniref:HAD family hydrolase n=1 Tax=Spongisporangium articulatum TaxID=3362603 RepID=A0ABW8AJZ2_9ACTN